MMWLVYIKNEFDNALTWCQIWNDDRVWLDDQKGKGKQILKKFLLKRDEWKLPLEHLKKAYPYKD